MKDEIRRLLASDPQRAKRASKFLSDSADPLEDIGELLLEARLEAAARFAPDSEPVSLWLVRLAGPQIEDGWLDGRLHDSIVGPLSREVENATPARARNEARLGLVGVSTGSVVLHFRPKSVKRAANSSQLSFDTSAADAAIQRVTHLHDLLEARAPAAQIGSLFKNDQAMLRQAKLLVAALSKNDVEISTRWWASNSRRSTSRLSREGQQHALDVFETAIDRVEEHVQGMVTALDINGIITVTGASRSRWRVTVGPEAIHSPRFALGGQVHFVALKEFEVDRVGSKPLHSTYVFVRHVEHTTLNFD